MYPAFKKWCDGYFLPSGTAASRVGLARFFFDDRSGEPHECFGEEAAHPKSPEEVFAFIKVAGDSVVPSYLPILKRRYNTPSTEHKRRW